MAVTKIRSKRIGDLNVQIEQIMSFFSSKFILVITKKRICRNEMFDLFFFSVYNSETLTELMSPNEKKTPLTVEDGRFKRPWLSKC